MVTLKLGKYGPLGISILGTAVIVFLALAQSFGWPLEKAQPLENVLIFIALTGLALLISLLVNGLALSDIRKVYKSRSEAEAHYLSQRNSLTPLLVATLDESLKQGQESLRDTFEPRGKLNLFIFSKVGHRHHVIASSVEVAAPVRRLSLAAGEGVVGFTYERGVATITELEDHGGNINNRFRESIGTQRPLTPANLEKCNVDLRMIYAHPIFYSPRAEPWSNQVIGILTVDLLEHADPDLYYKPEFQAQVQSIAEQIRPYVEAFVTLHPPSLLS